jgi:hypothetical protein
VRQTTTALKDPHDVVLLEDIEEGDGARTGQMPAPPRGLRIQEIRRGGDRAEPGAQVSRTATLALEVPFGAAKLVVLALDGEGQVMASTDLEVETGMPAEVFLDLLASGLVTEGLGALDLRVRITPEVAGALAAAARLAQKAGRAPRPLATSPRRPDTEE